MNNSDNKIKYQKIKMNKKNNNSFRINYIKKTNNEDKNIIKRIYNIHSSNNKNDDNKNKITNKHLDRKFYQKKILGINTYRENQLIKKMPIYINNNSSSNNNSDNLSSNRINHIYINKLYNTNNYYIKFNNSISNVSKKDKSFNFKRKLPKFKLTGSNNNMLYYNYLNNVTGVYTNMNKKTFSRANSSNDCLNIVNKLNRKDKRKNNSNKNSNRKFNSFSNNKNRLPYFIPS